MKAQKRITKTRAAGKTYCWNCKKSTNTITTTAGQQRCAKCRVDKNY